MEAFAPATVANLGPGFDFLGCAVEGLGDVVRAEICSETEAGEVRMGRIEGDGGGRLSMEAERNCAGIAGKATMEMLGVRKVGVRLSLKKGLPLGSGLGSSAASAAAGAMAVNELFGGILSKEQLVMAGMEAEAQVSGRHADNVAPSLLGGFVLVSSYSPLRLVKLPYPDRSELFFVLVSPEFEAPTKEMRSVLPTSVSLADHVSNCSQAAALVSAILTGDLALLGLSVSSDSIVEPLRCPLIPGMSHVKRSALLAGALGCTISGSGPTAVALAGSRAHGLLIAEAMVSSFSRHGNLAATAHVQRLNRIGATITSL
jgi:homoserine kinase